MKKTRFIYFRAYHQQCCFIFGRIKPKSTEISKPARKHIECACMCGCVCVWNHRRTSTVCTQTTYILILILTSRNIEYHPHEYVYRDDRNHANSDAKYTFGRRSAFILAFCTSISVLYSQIVYIHVVMPLSSNAVSMHTTPFGWMWERARVSVCLLE